MFGLFKKNNNECPVNEETRIWLEKCFLWLKKEFGEENMKSRKVLVPDFKNFPIVYNGSAASAEETMKIIAKQMEINYDEIVLDIYSEGQREVGAGGGLGNRIFLQNVQGEKYSGGLYLGKQEDNKYHIGLKEEKLKSPTEIVATLSHELSHIKLLGEKRIEVNNEHLTDLTTIIFGLGIFNANAAFQTKRGYDSWSWSKSGYLSQMEWGYALALFAYIRGEENPEWINSLTRNIKSDFIKSSNFIIHHSDKVFKSEVSIVKSNSKE